LIDVCGNLLEERSFPAPRKKQMPEEIVAKLRPVCVLVLQGRFMVAAAQSIGVT